MKRFVAVCMIVSKRCQPLPIAKAAFAGGSGETSQAQVIGVKFYYEFFYVTVEKKIKRNINNINIFFVLVLKNK